MGPRRRRERRFDGFFSHRRFFLRQRRFADLQGSYHRADGNRFAFSDVDLQNAIGFGHNFQGDFVGFYEKQGLVFFNAVELRGEKSNFILH